MEIGEQPNNSTRRRLSICHAGTYERDYPRNRLVIEALSAAGSNVEEVHVPVFEQWRDKSDRSPRLLAAIATRLVLAELRLMPDVALRLLRCRALMTGYVGQFDTLALGWIARAMGKPVIINPMITLTDTLVEDRKLAAEGSTAARIIAGVDRAVLQMADIVITDTAANGDYLTQRFGLDAEKICVVPVGADETIFSPPLTPSKPSGDRLDVLFYGKFIPLHGIETVVRAARIVQDEDVSVQFELVGRGQEYARIRALAEQLGIANIKWTEWVSFEHLGDRIRSADVVLGIFDEGAKAGRVIPNKLHQALACGAATITRCSPAIDEIARAGGTVAIPPSDPEALAKAVLALRDAEQRTTIGRAGYDAWRSLASAEALTEAARRVLERLHPTM